MYSFVEQENKAIKVVILVCEVWIIVEDRAIINQPFAMFCLVCCYDNYSGRKLFDLPCGLIKVTHVYKWIYGKSYIRTVEKDIKIRVVQLYTRLECCCEIKAWKKFRPQRVSNPWPLRYQCSALPTELYIKPTGSWSHWELNTRRWWRIQDMEAHIF